MAIQYGTDRLCSKKQACANQILDSKCPFFMWWTPLLTEKGEGSFHGFLMIILGIC